MYILVWILKHASFSEFATALVLPDDFPRGGDVILHGVAM